MYETADRDVSPMEYMAYSIGTKLESVNGSEINQTFESLIADVQTEISTKLNNSLETLEKLPKIIRRIYVLFIVMISFIIFNAESLGQAIYNIGGLFGANGEQLINNYTIYYLKSYLVVILVGIIGSTPVLKKMANNIKIHKFINSP